MVATTSPNISAAKEAFANLTAPQQAALMTETVCNIGSTDCIQQLTRLRSVTDLAIVNLTVMQQVERQPDFDQVFTATFYDCFYGKAERDFDMAFGMAVRRVVNKSIPCRVPVKEDWRNACSLPLEGAKQ